MLNNTRVKTILFFLACLFSFLKMMAQTDTISNPEEEDKRYMIIAGDSIIRESIDLEEVLILKRLNFKNNTDRKFLKELINLFSSLPLFYVHLSTCVSQAYQYVS